MNSESNLLLLSSHVRKIPGYQCKAYLDYLKSVAASYGYIYLLLSLVWPWSVRLFPVPGFDLSSLQLQVSENTLGWWEHRSCQPLGEDLRFPLSWCHNFLSLPRLCFPTWASFIIPLANWSGMEPLAAEKFNTDLAPICWDRMLV